MVVINRGTVFRPSLIALDVMNDLKSHSWFYDDFESPSSDLNTYYWAKSTHLTDANGSVGTSIDYRISKLYMHIFSNNAGDYVSVTGGKAKFGFGSDRKYNNLYLSTLINSRAYEGGCPPSQYMLDSDKSVLYLIGVWFALGSDTWFAGFRIGNDTDNGVAGISTQCDFDRIPKTKFIEDPFKDWTWCLEPTFFDIKVSVVPGSNDIYYLTFLYYINGSLVDKRVIPGGETTFSVYPQMEVNVKEAGLGGGAYLTDYIMLLTGKSKAFVPGTVV